ncbi:hypothetical protein Agub_g9770 [Astrephomene gubernaculifera]|uniref:Uncharacterized protein n=1 Tax=Astrephomene gubernaculifera TaxID=47775 RepID=A0AAD3DTT7_9CHLO|nr:hypothetical protein Agub_g9770 [Astrephomene gubernaculifera]
MRHQDLTERVSQVQLLPKLTIIMAPKPSSITNLSDSTDDHRSISSDLVAVEQKLNQFKRLYTTYQKEEVTSQLRASQPAQRDAVVTGVAPQADSYQAGASQVHESVSQRPVPPLKLRPPLQQQESSCYTEATDDFDQLSHMQVLLSELDSKDREACNLRAQLSKLQGQLHVQQAREDEARAGFQRQVQQLQEKLAAKAEQLNRLETERWEVLEAVSTVAAGSVQLDREQRDLERARLALEEKQRELAAREAQMQANMQAPEQLSSEDITTLATHYSELDVALSRTETAVRRRVLQLSGHDPDNTLPAGRAASGSGGAGRVEEETDLSHHPCLNYLQVVRDVLVAAKEHIGPSKPGPDGQPGTAVLALPAVRHLHQQSAGLTRALVLLASEAEADAGRHADAEAQIRERDARIVAALAENQRLAAQAAVQAAAAAQAESLAQQLQQQRQENEDLQSRLRNMRKKLKAAFEEMAAQNRDLREKLAAEQAARSSDAARLGDQVQRLQEELAEAEKQIQSHKMRDMQLLAELQEARQMATDTAAECAERLRGDMEAAGSRVAAAERRVADLEAGLLAERDSAARAASGHEAQMAALRADVRQQLQHVVDAYNEELGALHAQLARMEHAQRAAAGANAVGAIRSGGANGAAPAAGGSRVEAWRAAYEEMRELSESLKFQLDAAEQENVRLQTQLQRLTAAAVSNAAASLSPPAPTNHTPQLPSQPHAHQHPQQHHQHQHPQHQEPPRRSAALRSSSGSCLARAEVGQPAPPSRSTARAPSGPAAPRSAGTATTTTITQVELSTDATGSVAGVATASLPTGKAASRTRSVAVETEQEPQAAVYKTASAAGPGKVPDSELQETMPRRADAVAATERPQTRQQAAQTEAPVMQQPQQQKAAEDKRVSNQVVIVLRQDPPVSTPLVPRGAPEPAGGRRGRGPASRHSSPFTPRRREGGRSRSPGRGHPGAEEREGRRHWHGRGASMDGGHSEVTEDVGSGGESGGGSWRHEGSDGEGGSVVGSDMSSGSGDAGSGSGVDTGALNLHVAALQEQLAALTHQNSVITSQVIQMRQHQDQQGPDSNRWVGQEQLSPAKQAYDAPAGSWGTPSRPPGGMQHDPLLAPPSAQRPTAAWYPEAPGPPAPTPARAPLPAGAADVPARRGYAASPPPPPPPPASAVSVNPLHHSAYHPSEAAAHPEQQGYSWEGLSRSPAPYHQPSNPQQQQQQHVRSERQEYVDCQPRSSHAQPHAVPYEQDPYDQHQQQQQMQRARYSAIHGEPVRHHQQPSFHQKQRRQLHCQPPGDVSAAVRFNRLYASEDTEAPSIPSSQPLMGSPVHMDAHHYRRGGGDISDEASFAGVLTHGSQSQNRSHLPQRQQQQQRLEEGGGSAELATLRAQYARLQAQYDIQSARQREMQDVLLRISGERAASGTAAPSSTRPAVPGPSIQHALATAALAASPSSSTRASQAFKAAGHASTSTAAERGSAPAGSPRVQKSRHGATPADTASPAGKVSARSQRLQAAMQAPQHAVPSRHELDQPALLPPSQGASAYSDALGRLAFEGHTSSNDGAAGLASGSFVSGDHTESGSRWSGSGSGSMTGSYTDPRVAADPRGANMHEGRGQRVDGRRAPHLDMPGLGGLQHKQKPHHSRPAGGSGSRKTSPHGPKKGSILHLGPPSQQQQSVLGQTGLETAPVQPQPAPASDLAIMQHAAEHGQVGHPQLQRTTRSVPSAPHLHPTGASRPLSAPSGNSGRSGMGAQPHATSASLAAQRSSEQFITTTPFFPLGPETSDFLDRATTVDVGLLHRPDLATTAAHAAGLYDSANDDEDAAGVADDAAAGGGGGGGATVGSASTYTSVDDERLDMPDEGEDEEDDEDWRVTAAGRSRTVSSVGTTSSSSSAAGASRGRSVAAAAVPPLPRPMTAATAAAPDTAGPSPRHTTRSFLPVSGSQLQAQQETHGSRHGQLVPHATYHGQEPLRGVSAQAHGGGGSGAAAASAAPLPPSASAAVAGRAPGPQQEPRRGAGALDGPLVPPEVLERMARYAGDEGLARPSTAVPSALRLDAPEARGPPVPPEVLSYLEQYTGGGEGDVRPSTASPSVLRTGGSREVPVPPEVLSYMQQYTGDEGRARPSSAAPSVLSSSRSASELPVPELVLHMAAQYQAGGEGISRPATAPSSDERRHRLAAALAAVPAPASAPASAPAPVPAAPQQMPAAAAPPSSLHAGSAAAGTAAAAAASAAWSAAAAAQSSPSGLQQAWAQVPQCAPSLTSQPHAAMQLPQEHQQQQQRAPDAGVPEASMRPGTPRTRPDTGGDAGASGGRRGPWVAERASGDDFHRGLQLSAAELREGEQQGTMMVSEGDDRRTGLSLYGSEELSAAGGWGLVGHEQEQQGSWQWNTAPYSAGADEEQHAGGYGAYGEGEEGEDEEEGDEEDEDEEEDEEEEEGFGRDGEAHGNGSYYGDTEEEEEEGGYYDGEGGEGGEELLAGEGEEGEEEEEEDEEGEEEAYGGTGRESFTSSSATFRSSLPASPSWPPPLDQQQQQQQQQQQYQYEQHYLQQQQQQQQEEYQLWSEQARRGALELMQQQQQQQGLLLLQQHDSSSGDYEDAGFRMVVGSWLQRPAEGSSDGDGGGSGGSTAAAADRAAGGEAGRAGGYGDSSQVDLDPRGGQRRPGPAGYGNDDGGEGGGAWGRAMASSP